MYCSRESRASRAFCSRATSRHPSSASRARNFFVRALSSSALTKWDSCIELSPFDLSPFDLRLPSLLRQQVAEIEPLPRHDFAQPALDRLAEDRPVEYERVELAM